MEKSACLGGVDDCDIVESLREVRSNLEGSHVALHRFWVVVQLPVDDSQIVVCFSTVWAHYQRHLIHEGSLAQLPRLSICHRQIVQGFSVLWVV